MTTTITTKVEGALTANGSSSFHMPDAAQRMLPECNSAPSTPFMLATPERWFGEGGPGSMLAPCNVGHQLQHLQVHMNVLQTQVGMVTEQISAIEATPDAQVQCLRTQIGLLSLQVNKIEAQPELHIHELRAQIGELAEQVHRCSELQASGQGFDNRAQSQVKASQETKNQAKRLQELEATQKRMLASEAQQAEQMQALNAQIGQLRRLANLNPSDKEVRASSNDQQLAVRVLNFWSSKLTVLGVLAVLCLLFTAVWLVLFGDVLSDPASSPTKRNSGMIAEKPTTSWEAVHASGVGPDGAERTGRATVDATGAAAVTSTAEVVSDAVQAAGVDLRTSRPTLKEMDELHDAEVLSKILNVTGYTHVNMKDPEGRTLLHQALRLGMTVSAQTLLECRDFSGLNAHSSSGKNALHYASALGSAEIVQALLDNTNFSPLGARDNRSWTALHYAVAKDHLDVVKALVNHRRYIAEVGLKGNDSTWMLHKAATKGYLGIVRILLDTLDFKSVNARDMQGRTVLHNAVIGNHIDVVGVVMDHIRFIEVNAQSTNLMTALIAAAANGYITIANAVVDHARFTAVNAADSTGRTALHYAAIKGDGTLLMKIINKPGFNGLNTKTSRGSALHLATMSGHPSIVKLLIQQVRTDVNVRNDQGWTALHVAASYFGHTEVAKVLVKQAHTEVNTLDNTGSTALHHAAKHGHMSVANVLLQEGRFAEVSARSVDGQTALDIAEAKGYTQLAAAIRRRVKQDQVKEVVRMTREPTQPPSFSQYAGHSKLKSALEQSVQKRSRHEGKGRSV